MKNAYNFTPNVHDLKIDSAKSKHHQQKVDDVISILDAAILNKTICSLTLKDIDDQLGMLQGHSIGPKNTQRFFEEDDSVYVEILKDLGTFEWIGKIQLLCCE